MTELTSASSAWWRLIGITRSRATYNSNPNSPHSLITPYNPNNHDYPNIIKNPSNPNDTNDPINASADKNNTWSPLLLANAISRPTEQTTLGH